MPEKLVEIRNMAGQPVIVNGISITPHSQAFIIRLPRMIWGCIWNRPFYITVQNGMEPERTIPIWDITRLVQFGLLGMGLLGSYMIRRFNHVRK